MKYVVCQVVDIVDMSNEVIREVLFEHGSIDVSGLSIGCSVITFALGLKEFEVVYDKRVEPVHTKIIDIEYSLINQPPIIRAYLEPVKLIVGQHDVGSV